MSLRRDIEKNFRRIMEKVDRVSDKEAELDFDELEDQDLDNDGETDSSDKYLHKKLGMIAKMDEEEEELDEISTTAGVSGYDSPMAFGQADDDTIEAMGMKRAKKTNKIFKQMESKSSYKKMMAEMYGVESIDEAVSYREYKKDESATPSQKVNKSIMQVNKMLAEIERVVAHNLKLKTESGVNSNEFWKSTGVRFSKINERMVRISNRLKELSK